jgi:CheY-like chemotaxis protein
MISQILLVDDDKDEFMLMKDTFVALNLRVHLSYSNNYFSLSRYMESAATIPDMIFLDINMPRHNGRDCLIMIRNAERYKQVPVIMYSNSSATIDIETYLHLGATAFIVKPNNFERMKEVFGKLFSVDWKKTKPVLDDPAIFH